MSRKITHEDLLRAIGQLEGKFEAFETIPGRVATLEQSHTWFKGILAGIGAVFGWFTHMAWAR
jgi:hypothetical protein